jgi:hypothetical protein
MAAMSGAWLRKKVRNPWLVAAAVVLVLLYALINRTRLGSAILAISQDREGTQYMGIPINRIYSVVMGLSAAIAAAAGVLTAPFLTIQPTMGLLPMIRPSRSLSSVDSAPFRETYSPLCCSVTARPSLLIRRGPHGRRSSRSLLSC